MCLPREAEILVPSWAGMKHLKDRAKRRNTPAVTIPNCSRHRGALELLLLPRDSGSGHGRIPVLLKMEGYGEWGYRDIYLMWGLKKIHTVAPGAVLKGGVHLCHCTPLWINQEKGGDPYMK